MPFYDNYFSRSESISRTGKWIIGREVQNRIRLSRQLSGRQTLKALEFGPGRGHFARAALTEGWEYCAVDGSPAVLQSLRAEGMDMIEAFVPPVPAGIGTGYDLVLMEHFIEHMDSPATARNLVESLHASLAPQGLIFIVSPDFLAHRSNFWDCDYTHAFVTSIQRLRQLLLDSRYEIRYVGYETLGIQNAFVTWLISELTQILFLSRLPQLASLLLTGSTDPSSKWKNVLLRSCVIVGQRRS